MTARDTCAEDEEDEEDEEEEEEEEGGGKAPVIAGIVPGARENMFLLNWMAKPLSG